MVGRPPAIPFARRMLFGPPGQFNRTQDMEIHGFSHSGAARPGRVMSEERAYATGSREGSKSLLVANSRAQRRVELGCRLVIRVARRCRFADPSQLRNISALSGAGSSDPLLTPGPSMRASPGEILTTPAYRNAGSALKSALGGCLGEGPSHHAGSGRASGDRDEGSFFQ
jgi:hypothetical protein